MKHFFSAFDLARFGARRPAAMRSFFQAVWLWACCGCLLSALALAAQSAEGISLDRRHADGECRLALEGAAFVAPPEEFERDLLALVPKLTRFARKLTHERAAADDLLQDTLERAWKGRESFQMGTNLSAWVFRIMDHYWIYDRRKYYVRRSHGEMPLALDLDVIAAAHTPASQLDRLLLDELGNYMERELSPKLKNSLWLVFESGGDYEELARQLGIPEGTLKSRVSSARRMLLAFMDEEVPTREPASEGKGSRQKLPLSDHLQPGEKKSRRAPLPPTFFALCEKLKEHRAESFDPQTRRAPLRVGEQRGDFQLAKADLTPEMARLVERINHLPDSVRQVLFLHYLDGLPESEMAPILQALPESVRRYFRLGHKALSSQKKLL